MREIAATIQLDRNWVEEEITDYKELSIGKDIGIVLSHYPIP